MTTTAKKKELIDWISSMEDKDTLEQIFQFRKLKNQNFDKHFERAITVDELREETDVYIKYLFSDVYIK